MATLIAVGLCVFSQSVQAEDATVTRIEHKSARWEIELRSSTSEFPMGAQPLVLHIGDRTFKRSKPQRDLKLIVFYLSDSDYAAVSDGEEMSVTYGEGEGAERWSVPPLKKGGV